MIMSGIECAFGARVGTEPEVKIGKTSGKPWASFRACVGDKDTEQWLDVHVYGDKANSIPVTKGDRCYVEGKLRLEVRKGSDGVERPGLKVSAWRIERLGEIGRNKAAATQQTPAQAKANWQRPATSKASFDKPIDDEVPYAPELRG
jgi:single-stranded DNA-binding protein